MLVDIHKKKHSEQKRRNSGKKGFRTGGIQETRLVVFTTRGIKEMRNTGKRDTGKEGYRKEGYKKSGIQERRDSGL